MLATIDFEASSYHGYPIEVGVALWEPGTYLIRTWSSLIRPNDEWAEDNTLWDPQAQEIHGLDLASLLVDGRSVVEVARRLNQLLGSTMAHCDGGSFDAAFASRLYEAAGMAPTWRLGSMHDLVRAGCAEIWEARAVLKRIFSEHAYLEHRAGSDALRLMRELASETVERLTIIPLRE